MARTDDAERKRYRQSNVTSGNAKAGAAYLVELAGQDQDGHFDVCQNVWVDWVVVEPGHEVDEVVT